MRRLTKGQGDRGLHP